ncbi:BTB and MATH domain-containing protein 42-like [Oppia nitens]|uniref:BTB and MATH domain-containing protein 42-like n=1 Tax=Oppia nitens TaxID=1686743 RepID=UPI0023DA3B15|nr:BTB and MATH domain-containing protein 42-like [Oppia nitens]
MTGDTNTVANGTASQPSAAAAAAASASVSATLMRTSAEKLKYPEMDYFMNEWDSDVLFIIGDQRVPAIKHILSFKSPVFRAMFSENFREYREQEIVLEDTTGDAFRVMITYLYSERLVLMPDPEDMDLIQQVLRLADKYQLLRLMDACGRHLRSRITRANVEQIARFGYEYGLADELIPEVKRFLNENFGYFMSGTATVGQSSLNRLNDIMRNDLLELVVNNWRKTRDYLRNRIPDNTGLVGAGGVVDPPRAIQLNGCHYTYQSGQYKRELDFNNMN